MKTVAGERPLRFGIVCDGRQLQSWQLDCLKKLLAVPQVVPAMLLVRSAAVADPRVRGLFRYLSRPGTGSPASRAELPNNLMALPAVEMDERPNASDGATLTSGQAGSIRSAQLDFILTFSAASAHALSALATYGVWSFEFGDWQRFRGGPPGFWEVYRNAPVTAAMLIRLTEDPDVAIPLRRGKLRTCELSYARNRDQLLTRFIHWPAQVCRDILSGDTDCLRSEPIRSGAALNTAPCNKGMLRFGLRLAWYVATRGARPWFEHDHWNIGLIEQPIQDFVDPRRERKPVKWLVTPKAGEFVADPFGVVRDGRLTVFCEYLDYNTDGVGTIAALRPTGERVPVAIGPEPAVHLSYPAVFEHDGRLLCIPETQGAGEVALYGLERFPDKWVRLATLISNVRVVDATLFRHDRYWWLAGASDPGGAQLGADLHLWYANDNAGPWTAHPSNPVKTDVSSARPAGTPFVSEGVLYRPAQDSSGTYGSRVVINRVLTLTPVTFREEPVSYVEPDLRGPYPDGLHTLSAVGAMTLIDGKRLGFAPAELRRILRRMLMRRLRKLTG